MPTFKLRSLDLLGAVTVAACLSGCATASLQLAESARVAAPIDHVFVVVSQGPFDRSYADELADALLTALNEDTVACRSRVLTGLELDDDPVSEQLRAFGADGLLMVQPIGGEVNPINGLVLKVVYKVTLLEVRSDRVVWAARVSHQRGTFVARRGEMVAEQVVGSLIQEGVIRSGHSPKGGS